MDHSRPGFLRSAVLRDRCPRLWVCWWGLRAGVSAAVLGLGPQHQGVTLHLELAGVLRPVNALCVCVGVCELCVSGSPGLWLM